MIRVNLAPPDQRPQGSGVRLKMPLPRLPAFNLEVAVGMLYLVTVLALGAFCWRLSTRQIQLAAEVQRQTTDLAALKALVGRADKIEETLAELQKRLDAIQALSKAQAATARLNDVVVQKGAHATAVHLRTSLLPRYRASFIDTPSRLVIDMEDVTFGWRRGPLALDAPPFRQIRASQFRKNVTRVVIEFTSPANYAIREEPAGLVILVPIATGGGTAAAAPSRPATKPSSAEVPTTGATPSR
jgi:AMIN domain-containing protein